MWIGNSGGVEEPAEGHGTPIISRSLMRAGRRASASREQPSGGEQELEHKNEAEGLF